MFRSWFAAMVVAGIMSLIILRDEAGLPTAEDWYIFAFTASTITVGVIIGSMRKRSK